MASVTTERRPSASPKLVIFDCDGVLVDSEPVIRQAMRSVLARHGLQLRPDELRAHFHGSSHSRVRAVVKAQWGVLLPDDIVDLLEDAERVAVEDGLRAVPGVAEVVHLVAASELASCVASNGSPDAIEQRLKLTGLYPWFEGRLFSAAMVARGKPYPDVFLHAAETMGFSPEQCVVIEDSDAGIQAALAAGMRVLAFAAKPARRRLARRASRRSRTWLHCRRCSDCSPPNRRRLNQR